MLFPFRWNLRILNIHIAFIQDNMIGHNESGWVRIWRFYFSRNKYYKWQWKLIQIYKPIKMESNYDDED